MTEPEKKVEEKIINIINVRLTLGDTLVDFGIPRSDLATAVADLTEEFKKRGLILKLER